MELASGGHDATGCTDDYTGISRDEFNIKH
jgi:hypothetical protein